VHQRSESKPYLENTKTPVRLVMSNTNSYTEQTLKTKRKHDEQESEKLETNNNPKTVSKVEKKNKKQDVRTRLFNKMFGKRSRQIANGRTVVFN